MHVSAITLARVFRAALAPRLAGLFFALTATCAAQGIDELRNELRKGLRTAHFAKSLNTLVIVSDELELSGARFEFDDEYDTDLWTFGLPMQKSMKAFGDGAPELYLEGALGFARARQYVGDIYSGLLPALATSVDTDWTTYSALAGGGLRFALSDEFTLTPILDVGIAHIENDTDYGGPGATFTAALADGIAFNWDAWLWSAGGAGRIDWTHPLGEHHEVRVIARYDLRWVGTLRDDDAAQDFTSRAQMITLRGDVTGTTGLQLFDRELDWRGTLGYRRFLEGDLYGTEDFLQVGGALEWGVREALPFASRVSLSGAVFVGENVTGWSVGFGISF
ncbi:MAG: autotransporter outer membrane beta-barrel domain-containing protein [Planctomycetes bacterium]|nr:autotransporter outer membrane beta-barrel domain-containing protein [Planctomycetota bacterium]